MVSVDITAANVAKKSELLLGEWGRTASLLPHNVVLMPLGNDFRYDIPEEFDQQYENYEKIAQFINQNRHKYHAQVQWGTLKDYFTEVLVII